MTPSNPSITIERRLKLRRDHSGNRSLEPVAAPPPQPVEDGRVPRVSQVLALAIRMRRLVDEGAVRDYSELARLSGISTARMTQIMQLLLLAPDIQQEILFLPRILQGRTPIHERLIRPITALPSWSRQRVEWERLKARTTPGLQPEPNGT